jgi:hypothetical protein
MQEITDIPDQGEISMNTEPAQLGGKQLFIAIALGAIVLVAVMLVMVLAVKQAPATSFSKAGYQPMDASSAIGYARYITVEGDVSRFETNVIGSREIEIKGYVRNTGSSAVKAADLRCYFMTVSGGESSLELPLIADTRLEEVGNGWLMPMSGREFGVRAGEFPEGLKPELSRLEVINVRVRSLR